MRSTIKSLVWVPYLDQSVLSRYCSTPADLALLHSMCRTAQHRLQALKATVLASAACGLGITTMCEVNRLENKS